MKKILKKVIIKILNSALGVIGFELKRSEITKHIHSQKDNLLQNFYQLLLKFDFHPQHIFDVGANHGTWTRVILNYFPNAKYTLIEPQYWLKKSFQDLLNNYNISFYPIGVGREEGSFKFTIVNRDDSSSFRYTEEEALEKGFKQQIIPVKTIDKLIAENELSIPEIVKIDAEGLDLDVLEGANSLFGKTEIFLIEAGIMNKDFSNNALSVISYMDEKDYRLFDITDINRPFPSKVLWLVELVFIKKNGFLDKQNYIK